MSPNWQVVLGSDPERTATFIGAVVAICGNILISFALNCQKLAHRRIEAAYNAEHGLDDESGLNGTTVPEYHAVVATSPVDVVVQPGHSRSLPIATPGSRTPVASRQAIPLVVSSSPESRPSLSSRSRTQSTIRTHSPIRERTEHSNGTTTPAEATVVDDLEAGSKAKSLHGPDESAYLHSKLW
jgi:hypothetical protein